MKRERVEKTSSDTHGLERKLIESFARLPIPLEIIQPEKSANGCYEWRFLEGNGQAPSFTSVLDEALHFMQGRLAGKEFSSAIMKLDPYQHSSPAPQVDKK